jgi:predicted NBD/HSP70 family sugar kinase
MPEYFQIGSDISGTKMLQIAVEGGQICISTHRLQLLFEDRDPISLQTIEHAGAALGLGLANLINLFNPAAIVLSSWTLHWHGYLEVVLHNITLILSLHSLCLCG